jgi:hypothetical protein
MYIRVFFTAPPVLDVSSSSPGNDSYPLTNLLSASAAERRTGFLAESFVRPPVSIKVKFGLNGPGFRLRQISFSSRVSYTQESEFFEVLVKGNRDADFVRAARGGPNPDTRGAIHQLLNIILQLRILVLLLVSTLPYVVKVKNYS